jgi:hypothetical protein
MIVGVGDVRKNLKFFHALCTEGPVNDGYTLGKRKLKFSITEFSLAVVQYVYCT